MEGALAVELIVPGQSEPVWHETLRAFEILGAVHVDPQRQLRRPRLSQQLAVDVKRFARRPHSIRAPGLRCGDPLVQLQELPQA